MMGFLKKLFGGFDSASDDGIYVYIRLRRRHEVVRLRLNPSADLNPDYESGQRISRKHIVGPRTYERAEAVLRFDDAYHLVDADIEGGELVDEAAWLAYQEGQNA